VTNTYPTGDCLKRLARDAAVLAFLRAWRQTGRRDQACADAFKAYLAISPNDHDASKQVIEALIEMIRSRPDWSDAMMQAAPPSPPISQGEAWMAQLARWRSTALLHVSRSTRSRRRITLRRPLRPSASAVPAGSRCPEQRGGRLAIPNRLPASSLP